MVALDNRLLMISSSVVADGDDGKKPVMFIFGATELVVSVIVLIESEPLGLLVLVDTKHELLALTIEGLAIGHQLRPELLEGRCLPGGGGHHLHERGEFGLGLGGELCGHPATVVGQVGALSARATGGQHARARCQLRASSNDAVSSRCSPRIGVAEGSMARELRDASNFGASVLLVVVSLNVQHRELLWGHIHASTEEAGRNATLVYVTLNHFGGMEKGGMGMRGGGGGCGMETKRRRRMDRQIIIWPVAHRRAIDLAGALEEASSCWSSDLPPVQ